MARAPTSYRTRASGTAHEATSEIQGRAIGNGGELLCSGWQHQGISWARLSVDCSRTRELNRRRQRWEERACGESGGRDCGRYLFANTVC